MTQYATLAQLTDYLELSGTLTTQMTNNLNMALTNASAAIDDFTHRTFVAAADATRTHDALLNVEWGNLGSRLWLNGDLAQLTSVTNGDGANVPLSSLVTEPSYARPIYALVLKSNSGIAWTYTNGHEQAISVTGRWAYSATPPDAIVQACLRLSAWMYRQPANAFDLDRAVIVGNTTIAPAQLPADVLTLLAPYRKALS